MNKFNTLSVVFDDVFDEEDIDLFIIESIDY